MSPNLSNLDLSSHPSLTAAISEWRLCAIGCDHHSPSCQQVSGCFRGCHTLWHLQGLLACCCWLFYLVFSFLWVKKLASWEKRVKSLPFFLASKGYKPVLSTAIKWCWKGIEYFGTEYLNKLQNLLCSNWKINIILVLKSWLCSGGLLLLWLHQCGTESCLPHPGFTLKQLCQLTGDIYELTQVEKKIRPQMSSA